MKQPEDKAGIAKADQQSQSDQAAAALRQAQDQATYWQGKEHEARVQLEKLQAHLDGVLAGPEAGAEAARTANDTQKPLPQAE